MSVALPTLKDIEDAQRVLSQLVRNTPMKRSTTLSHMTGADMYLKLENFQRTGSFKVRGALNKLHSLTPEQRACGVVAASAGNHAQGVAFAATHFGVKSSVFMPEGAAHAKVVATKGYGASIHLKGSDYQEAYEAAVEQQKATGAVFVHAYDDPFIMAGQGTLGLEILDDAPELDTVLVPIGGGGLIGGVATALKASNPNIRIIGVQAEGASTVAQSLQKGRVVPATTVDTMADGIACRVLGTLPFAAIQAHVDDIVTVSETEIASAILFLLERTKVAVEGAGAVTLAAAMHGKVDLKGARACCIVSGGNIDMTLLSRIIQRGLVKERRVAMIRCTLPDSPGAMADMLRLLADERANVLNVNHDRLQMDIPMHLTHVEIQVEVRGPDHLAVLQVALAKAGFEAVVEA